MRAVAAKGIKCYIDAWISSKIRTYMFWHYDGINHFTFFTFGGACRWIVCCCPVVGFCWMMIVFVTCCCCWLRTCCCWCCCLVGWFEIVVIPVVVVEDAEMGDASWRVVWPGIGSDWPEWLCDVWCFFNSRLSRYPRWQTAQTNGFSPIKYYNIFWKILWKIINVFK